MPAFKAAAPSAALLLTAAVAVAPPAGRPAAGPPAGQRVNGAELATELGCAACHAGVGDPDRIRARAPALGPGGTPLGVDFVFDYLGNPVRRRPDIGASRMPDFQLDERERLALARYLGGEGATAGAALAALGERAPEADAALGARIFSVLGCAGCHAHPDGSPTRVGPDLSREGARVRPEWLRAWLARPGPIRTAGQPVHGGARMPDFRLSAAETDALAGYLATLGSAWEGPPPPISPFVARRTERLVEERVACLGCHAVGGRGGAIGPPLDGVAARLRPGFVAEIVLDPGRAAPGAPMPHQPLPEREARRIARLLLDRGGAWQAAGRRSLADAEHPAWSGRADDDGTGEALYARHCVACHGPAGGGDGWNAPALPVSPTVHADSAAMARRSDDTLFDGIWAGAFVLDGSARMPPFGGLLSPEQVRLLVRHIRELCACEGPPWSREGAGG